MKTTQTTMHRSGAKWLPSAMAIAATTASSQAATVQITLLGNKVSTTGGNQLNADLTGDGGIDIAIDKNGAIDKILYATWGVAVWVKSGGAAYANQSSGTFNVNAKIFSGALGDLSPKRGYSPLSQRALNPISFSDARVNGGLLTEGWLEVHAFNTSATNHTVQFTRLIFDDASVTRPGFTAIPDVQTAWTAVPEPSSFALLGLGAAGVLARRRRQAA
jgi:hypothetical protein